jgi:hypothetical protein
MSNDLAKAQTVVDDNGTCRACGSQENIGVHHITPRAQDGDEGRGNLLVLCALCEKHVHAETPKACGARRQVATRARAFNIGLLREMTLVARRYPRAFYLKHMMSPKTDPSDTGVWIGNAFDRFRDGERDFAVKWADGVEVAFRKCRKSDARLGADSDNTLAEGTAPQEGRAT